MSASKKVKCSLFITVLVIYTVSCSAQVVNDDLAFFNYSYNKDHIRLNHVETITIEMLSDNGKKSARSIYHFDKNGLLTKQVIQDSAEKIKREFYFITNSYGDLITRIQKDHEHHRIDTVLYFKSYKGDKLVKDSSSEMAVNQHYEYSKNRLLLITTITSNVGLGNYSKRIIVNTYDSLNRIIKVKETTYQNDNDNLGMPNSDREIFYSNNGKIEKEVERINGKYSWMANKGSITYFYDVHGNLTQIQRTNGASYTYTYNDNGLILTKKMNFNSEPDAFDNEGMKIETVDKYSYTFRK